MKYSRIRNQKPSSHRGFTLIEIIVSLGLFAIVAIVAAGALLKILDSNKKAQSIQNTMTNLSAYFSFRHTKVMIYEDVH